ncbi:unnamed protein product [Notodromas monacha]|uniref:Cation-transporting P-type ATPase N-terminal domain-containing protein n=1 Tax=Notodromas monacha TaxID=399045 RepID=A0A7R9BVU8_9CRUS|nr:unnamed protein product [Notodromas monacha]CAG0921710.1 unnamed protein product [Notodromas monacha]
MTDPSGADSQTDKPTLSELVRIMRMSKQDALSHLKNQYGGTEGLCVALETHPENGLSGNLEDLQSRRQEYGKNELPTEKPKTFLRLILETLKDFTVVILITSSIVSLVLYIVLLFLLPTPPAGSSGYSTGWVDTVSVLCSVALVVILTAYSEYTKQIRFITLLSQSENERSIFVRRNAAKESLRCQDLVVGDIVELGVGNVVPVDGILLKGFNLKVEESVLTGETHLIAKTPKDDPIIFSGSHVIEGEGKMVSIVVGPHSTLGQIILMGAKGHRSAKLYIRRT